MISVNSWSRRRPRQSKLWGAFVSLVCGIALGGEALVTVEVSDSDPARSRAVIRAANGNSWTCPVGSGKDGIKEEGETFANGWSLAGTFRIDGILATGRFEMTPDLVRASGKSEAELRTELFANMSRIDFDGDGVAGEYGQGFLGLTPELSGEQPFGFRSYRGIFRWYCYAIHGTEDQSRVGKRSTGGCINLRSEDLERLLEVAKLGDRVEIRRVP